MKYLLLIICLASNALAANYEPTWASSVPKRVIQHTNPSGASLVKAVEALIPGDKLEITSGTYIVERMWDLKVSNTMDTGLCLLALGNETPVQVYRPKPAVKAISLTKRAA